MKVLDEFETLRLALAGRSIARFGDGELRLARGGQAASQKPDPKLAQELLALLKGPTKSIVCLPWPNVKSPKLKNWLRYAGPDHLKLYRQQTYGSAFITRPDSAPWIECEEYMRQVYSLWAGKECVLVVGSDATSLRSELLRGAKGVRVIVAPRRDAYDVVDQIEADVGQHESGPVLLCLGATATVLAERLAKKNMHALDLGHIGWMVKRWYSRL